MQFNQKPQMPAWIRKAWIGSDAFRLDCILRELCALAIIWGSVLMTRFLLKDPLMVAQVEGTMIGDASTWMAGAGGLWVLAVGSGVALLAASMKSLIPAGLALVGMVLGDGVFAWLACALAFACLGVNWLAYCVGRAGMGRLGK